MSNAVAKRQSEFQNLIARGTSQIKKALPKHMSEEKFVRVVCTAVKKVPKLLECTQDSLLNSIMLAAQLGMEPNSPLHQCVLIPYGKEVQFQLEYRGMLALVRNSGEVSTIHAEVVYENDEIDITLGSENPTITHKPLLTGDRGIMIMAYSVAKFKDGSTDFVWMSKPEIIAIKKKAVGNKTGGPWTTNESEMWKKTVLKRHCKTLPMSAEASRAISVDETVKSQKTPEDFTELLDDSTSEPKELEAEGKQVSNEPAEKKETTTQTTGSRPF